MPIIDLTYFTGDINIAQLGQLAVQEKVNGYIKKYEPDILSKLLGYQLYKDFTAGLTADPIEQKWLDLRDGVEYTGKHGLTKWVGLTNKDGSLIANYVYFQYVRSEAKFLVGSGAITPKVENAARVSPIELQVYAWNEMVRLNIELLRFLKAKEDVYGPLHIEEWHYLPDFLYGCCTHHRRHELLETINSFNL